MKVQVLQVKREKKKIFFVFILSIQYYYWIIFNFNIHAYQIEPLEQNLYITEKLSNFFFHSYLVNDKTTRPICVTEKVTYIFWIRVKVVLSLFFFSYFFLKHLWWVLVVPSHKKWKGIKSSSACMSKLFFIYFWESCGHWWYPSWVIKVWSRRVDEIGGRNM